MNIGISLEEVFGGFYELLNHYEARLDSIHHIGIRAMIAILHVRAWTKKDPAGQSRDKERIIYTLISEDIATGEGKLLHIPTVLWSHSDEPKNYSEITDWGVMDCRDWKKGLAERVSAVVEELVYELDRALPVSLLDRSQTIEHAVSFFKNGAPHLVVAGGWQMKDGKRETCHVNF
ncbi:MAG: hypothetical protein QOG91_608 [Candidatus Parcubacteria bacterium]|jgi:hypothetical protein|nr:hypothetical protein [Candidatus Parcubacteria bacterium]